MAPYQQFRLFVGVGIIAANKNSALHDLAVRTNEVGAVLRHSGVLRRKRQRIVSLLGIVMLTQIKAWTGQCFPPGLKQTLIHESPLCQRERPHGPGRRKVLLEDARSGALIRS